MSKEIPTDHGFDPAFEHLDRPEIPRDPADNCHTASPNKSPGGELIWCPRCGRWIEADRMGEPCEGAGEETTTKGKL